MIAQLKPLSCRKLQKDAEKPLLAGAKNQMHMPGITKLLSALVHLS